MKKLLSVLLSAVLIVTALAGCSSAKNTSNSDDKSLKIVATIFPEYDWVKQILGSKASKADITLLLDNGVDLHSYQPSAEDIVKISTCDMFIYVGGESDEWVEDVLADSQNKDMVAVNLMEVLGDKVKDEEAVEGMEAEHEEEEPDNKIEAEEEEEKDEHVWLSLKNAGAVCTYIADRLAEIDAKNAQEYKSNAQEYVSQLNNLDMQYQQAVNDAGKKTLLFGDRFPFRYLVDDYGLSYYAAFLGCSAETEASFETITFLAQKTDELNLSCVLKIEGGDGKIAKTIVSNTKSKSQKILSLDSMQSTDSVDIDNGANYLDIMQKNLDVLKQALA